MKDLIAINIDKRLSIISMIFIIISLVLIYYIFIYQAAINISDFNRLNNINLIKENYIIESIQTIEIVSVFFVIFLVGLELFQNTNNFDAYFISITNKTDYLIAKLISYLIIILAYVIIIFLGLIIIYLFQIKEIKCMNFIVKIFLYYIVFLIYIFMLTYVALLLFHNYFSNILVFILYWISKIVEEETNFKKFIFLNVKIDYISENVTFSFEYRYLFFLLITLLILCFLMYKSKDLHLN